MWNNQLSSTFTGIVVIAASFITTIAWTIVFTVLTTQDAAAIPDHSNRNRNCWLKTKADIPLPKLLSPYSASGQFRLRYVLSNTTYPTFSAVSNPQLYLINYGTIN
jgi:hypothetical protein